VKTGETVSERVYGVPIFEHFAQNKETSEIFNAAMTSFSNDVIPPVLEAYDFSWLNGKTLADIAGGHGAVLGAFLEKYPHIHGKLFALEHVLEGAKERFASGPLAGRCNFCSGDFFKEVPTADAYVMKHIIHDWDDEKSLQILRNCRRAGSANARVILIEAVIQPGNEPHPAKWLDLEMMLLPGGKERTEAEFAELFERAGFRLERIVRTKSPLWVVEAAKVS
jgi:O-methyltransferase domain